jgi:hypothetical protein
MRGGGLVGKPGSSSPLQETMQQKNSWPKITRKKLCNSELMQYDATTMCYLCNSLLAVVRDFQLWTVFGAVRKLQGALF